MLTRTIIVMGMLLPLCACSPYRVKNVVTSFQNGQKPVESLTRDYDECSLMARTPNATDKAGANASGHDSLQLLGVMNLVDSTNQNATIEQNISQCLAARGWTPRLQFVNTDYLQSSNSFLTAFNYCREKAPDKALIDSVAHDMDYLDKFLQDDESISIEKREQMEDFAKCLIMNGWWLVPQEPWYKRGQGLEYMIRYIPKGKWQLITETENSYLYYDLQTVVRENTKVLFKVLVVPKTESDPRTWPMLTELDCKNKIFRQSASRLITDRPWLNIPSGGTAAAYYYNLCGR